MFLRATLLAIILAFGTNSAALAESGNPDPDRDILVTFDNRDAVQRNAGIGAPYQNRKRYVIAADARRHARAIAKEYSLTQVDHWPIKSLSVYCYVYRVADADQRDAIIERLEGDDRVESVQPLQTFETGTAEISYDDTYANLQHGLNSLGILEAHRFTTGKGVRVAIVDSDADVHHEDLAGRVRRLVKFTAVGHSRDAQHGTAVASIIGAIANNATGIVGVAPASELEILVACWRNTDTGRAICDSFTLAKAIDTLLDDPPDVLNLSLTGPFDPLLERLLQRVVDSSVIVIAAEPAELTAQNLFPSSANGIIAVASSRPPGEIVGDATQVFAPGDRILVALPDDDYDIRSGSSLAAAHVSGVVALLLAVAPNLTVDKVQELLYRSQIGGKVSMRTVNACRILQLADNRYQCSSTNDSLASQKDSVTLSATRASARSAELTIGTHRFVSW